ncbi:uncharacterized protein LOC120631404 isoform X2 [Pararge aegeria]|uniref:uncharacterized protein LOC120631404 isoform X2 n=1 Tax=Pararge aegeria TaxID=116150 RepID=UPI0019D1450C|nr:uncharacterized protein LOC120631404 isoform X2 [Pararge aegeria]
MDERNLKRTTSYDRVMPRVYNTSHPSSKSNSRVTRHETAPTQIGAKPSSSNLSSSVFRELPLVLSGYKVEQPVDRTKVPKPKRTLKSLDPGKSPLAPDEIKAFQKTQKLMQLRSHLYKKCGVVLDDVGQVAVDKAVQVQEPDNTPGDSKRTQWREDAGAAVSDKQMRPAVTPYPVDRYLVESRKQIDMVNIIGDDIWNAEPALRPEDEILLRKLHDMLQTTADDLKLLSGELSKYHESGVQVKTLPMPLDEEFNEKVHIEEVVNARFYGNKIVGRTQSTPITSGKVSVASTSKFINDIINRNNEVKTNIQPNKLTMLRKQPLKKKLQMSGTNIMNIKENLGDEQLTDKQTKINIAQESKCIAKPAVAYNEVCHEYIKSNMKRTPQKSLQIQEMPSIDIRSELRLQNVLHIDISPESIETSTQQPVQQNALVIEMQHEPPLENKQTNLIKFDNSQYISIASNNRPATRKVSTMTACASSESNNNSSDSQQRLQTELHNISIARRLSKLDQKVVRNTKKSNTIKKGPSRPHANLEEWKKKLNTVYSRPLNTQSSDGKRRKASKNAINNPSATVKVKENKNPNQSKPGLNNAEYIPYSKFTLGGVNVSDIEREISNIPNKSKVVLSPILDKILSSRENSFHNDSPKKEFQIESSKIFTTSDENLLQEVLDIETKVSHTLKKSKNTSTASNESIQNKANGSPRDDSYVDDFEDEKSDASEHTKPTKSETSKTSHSLSDYSGIEENNKPNVTTEEKNRINDSNMTFTKAPNLSLKNKVDVFEFVHSVDTQETGTQSNTSNKITPKETQTSPRDERNVQPIHNDLWPSTDPRGEVEKMFKLEKEFIKKLIIDEYGDLLEKSLNKPSTSGKIDNENSERNMAASQKITQTSPARAKSVMTSPTRTKTRTTSPFALSMNVYQQTSPIAPITNEEELKVELENDDLGISANLSSPRFSLRLPETSRDVFSKLEIKVQNNKQTAKYDILRRHVFSSSSSVDGDYSSSDISSLGEINEKFKRLKKSRILSISEISSTSSQSKYNSDPSGAILPLRSEGEASVRQINRKKTNKSSRSDGEVSLGQPR